MEEVHELVIVRPGIVLDEGLKWDWESFPEFLDALENQPRAIDIAAQQGKERWTANRDFHRNIARQQRIALGAQRHRGDGDAQTAHAIS